MVTISLLPFPLKSHKMKREHEILIYSFRSHRTKSLGININVYLFYFLISEKIKDYILF